MKHDTDKNGIIDENGALTNAGALLADDSPVRHSRIFCTRWNGLTMTSGLGEALDDAELEGSVIGLLQDVVKEPTDFTKDFTKEFTKAQRRIYRLISMNPKVSIDIIAEDLNLSTRQVKTYMKRLSDLHLIAREGGRKNGSWKILDKDYDEFFERI